MTFNLPPTSDVKLLFSRGTWKCSYSFKLMFLVPLDMDTHANAHLSAYVLVWLYSPGLPLLIILLPNLLNAGTIDVNRQR